jgi:anti-sigma regulatory factor (Ser/Thr protein kinase)
VRGASDHPVDPGVESASNSGAAPAIDRESAIDPESDEDTSAPMSPSQPGATPVGGYESSDSATIALRSEPASVALARRFARSWMGPRAESSIVDDLVLVVSELVTNAVRHSSLAMLGISRTDGCVRVEVDDEDGGDPTLTPDPHAGASSGRGLLIIEQLVTRWGWNRLPGGGKRVWCELCPDAARA